MSPNMDCTNSRLILSFTQCRGGVIINLALDLGGPGFKHMPEDRLDFCEHGIKRSSSIKGWGILD